MPAVLPGIMAQMTMTLMPDAPHLRGLNPPQQDAVTAPPGPLLVLAGAGSGKTRVLTHRIAWLIQEGDLLPSSVLAVTFTNKAAAEMRGRIEQLLRVPAGGLWVGTFHGLSHRLLRTHWQEAGLPQTFQIIDSDDQMRILKRLIRNAGLDDAHWPARELAWFINGHKEEGRRPTQPGSSPDPGHAQRLTLYSTYEDHCRRAGLVDFAELLLRAVELLRGNETLRAHYQRRFRHVLVDEFQDTNAIQYQWLRQFVNADRSLTVVGDDDQSIYGWRGAKVENILRFEHDYPGTQVVRLEQNYRSTGHILKAANAVIAQNGNRLGKNLWTADGAGAPVRLFSARNEYEEADFVLDRIRAWTAQGKRREQVAILYRSNAQSRVFEENLIRAQIPYRVYGGMRFFERAEIKDALAYLRLMRLAADDASFERVCNVPTRGLGDRTLESVREHAKTHTLSLWSAAEALLTSNTLASRAASSLRGFLEIVQRMRAETEGLELDELMARVIEFSGLKPHFAQEKGEKGEARIENLDELVNAARGFEHDPDEGLDALSAFLAHAALEAGEAEAGAGEDCVQLMTLHSAKGLEFDCVFLAGLEEGLFPHARSIEEPARLEEERRLCYVGMTRARRELYLSWAEMRRLHGREQYAIASRFVSELPEDAVEETRLTRRTQPWMAGGPGGAQAQAYGRGHNVWPGSGAARDRTLAGNSAPPPAATAFGPFRLGVRVTHAKFGEGVVLSLEGSGEHARVQVNFSRLGQKWLVLAYAKLTVV